ncbi:MAG: NAD(P)-dependent oxidoreductase [Rhizobacter sp.]|nr:NAD(P)-dependent oxidoreductase [Rhizobacter sp.]
MAALRLAGAVPLLGDLDRPETLSRLAGLAGSVLHLAPPPASGGVDTRTRHLLSALVCRGGAPSRIVYASTSGVYGDCGGALIDETRAVQPRNPRAIRRVDAERQLREFGIQQETRTTVLRIPGIYAADRAGGDPRDRLARGTPVLRTEDDVFTNHIHADDLARACVAALFRGRPQRVVNACDDTEMRMGDYFDLAADIGRMPRPQRIARAEAAEYFSPMAMSFMDESRRIGNDRLKHELGVRLRYPTVREGLAAIAPAVPASDVKSPEAGAAS